MVMRRHVILPSGVLMTGCAGLVAWMFELQGVWVVTIRAANSLVVHLALDKRTVDVDFVFDLSVGKVGVFLKEFELEMIAIRVTGLECGV